MRVEPISPDFQPYAIVIENAHDHGQIRIALRIAQENLTNTERKQFVARILGSIGK